ncbi:signal peptidase I [Enterococcus sp. DIV0840]|uniref:signal peptidase I n=1 Tax=Enterococcus TaxID=1350 RepID=UPI001A8E2BB4|nr:MULTISPECIES: signal peptidase I [Enterococcus]MBO0435489.1 signal peptidase I [Enterococcus sp. DIV0849a]MBO0473355.1 signal peptidase I [Enterococcus ureasiticus]
MDKKIKHKNQRAKKKRKHKQLLNLVSNSVFFLCVCLCVLFLFKVKPHIVEGSSMFPTLENGDRIFVNKGEVPKRYSIITLDPLKKKKESYVKRVIGLPGDSIWLEGTNLFLNQERSSFDSKNNKSTQLPDGTIKITVNKAVAQEMKGMKQIPKDNYFVLGDNRNHSNDSRSFGFVSTKQIEGVAMYRYYPLDRLGRLH